MLIDLGKAQTDARAGQSRGESDGTPAADGGTPQEPND